MVSSELPPVPLPADEEELALAPSLPPQIVPAPSSPAESAEVEEVDVDVDVSAEPAPAPPPAEPLGFGEVSLEESGESHPAAHAAAAEDHFGVPLPEDPFSSGTSGGGPSSVPVTLDDDQPPSVGTSAQSDDLEMLFGEGEGRANRSGEPTYRIRRSSGKVIGPYPGNEIALMLERGEFNGNEEVALHPGESWMPVGKVPVFAEALKKAAERATLPNTVATDGPGIPQLSAAMNARPRWRLALFLVVPLLAVAAAGVGAGFTHYGWFFRNLISPHRGGPKLPVANNAKPPPKAAEARLRLLEDRLETAQLALESADQALIKDPKDVKGAGLYCLAACWLAVHGAPASDALARARSLSTELATRAPKDPETFEAQVANAIATKTYAAAAPAVADLERHARTASPPDEVALALLGDLALARKDSARAEVVPEVGGGPALRAIERWPRNGRACKGRHSGGPALLRTGPHPRSNPSGLGRRSGTELPTRAYRSGQRREGVAESDRG